MADTANRSRGSGRRVRGAFVPEARCGYRNPTLSSILATQVPCRTPSRSEALRSATDALRRLLARRSAGSVLKPSGGNCAVLPYICTVIQPCLPCGRAFFSGWHLLGTNQEVSTGLYCKTFSENAPLKNWMKGPRPKAQTRVPMPTRPPNRKVMTAQSASVKTRQPK